jgi:hypothetical protein
MKLSYLLFLLTFSLNPIFSFAKTIYVNQNATGTQDGSSWGNAFVFIDDALASWQTDDTIWVAKGQYSPKDSIASSTFSLPSGCVLMGGFAGTEKYASQRDYKLNETILSGEILSETTTTDNIRTIVTVLRTAQGTKIDGFILKDGYNRAIPSDFTDGGAAIRITDAYLDIENCTFVNNYAYMRGGAIYQQTSSKQINIINCIFENNTTGVDQNSLGGAIYANSANLYIQDCEFNLNTSQSGGAIAMYEASLVADRCIFSGNEARIRYGGAIYDGSDSKFSVYNSLFVGNVANEVCPAIYSNSVFNTKRNEIINCTFSDNLAKETFQSYTLETNKTTKIYNCIFSENVATDNIFYNAVFEPDVQNCLFENGIDIGKKNIKGSPLFISKSNGYNAPFHHKDFDYRLKSRSRCIGAGENSLIDSDYNLDLDGNERPLLARVCMGAFEADYDLILLDLNVKPITADTLIRNGFYPRDTTIILEATASECYDFVSYTSGTRVLSENEILTIKLTSDTVIQANYEIKTFEIKKDVYPQGSGTIDGNDEADCGRSTTLNATPTNGWKFVEWQENGEVVSTDASFTFNVKENRSLTAHFEENVGVLDPSVFDVSIYPNPANDLLNVDLGNKAEESNISIIDLNGKEVFSRLKSKGITQIDMLGIENGVYTVIIQNQEVVIAQRLIVNHTK